MPEISTTETIKEYARELGLKAIPSALEEQNANSAYADLGFEKRLLLLLEAEVVAKQNRKVEYLRSQAKLSEKSAHIENITYAPGRGLDKSQILELSSGHYLRTHSHVILTGPTGTGKSYLAQALANKAMIQGQSAYYLRIPRLMQQLSTIRNSEAYLKLLARLRKMKLLILDDFGVAPLKAQEARDLLEIIEDKTHCGSIIVTSQLPVGEWHDYLHNATIADAILDRLVHRSHRIELSGESMRKSTHQKTALEGVST